MTGSAAETAVDTAATTAEPPALSKKEQWVRAKVAEAAEIPAEKAARGKEAANRALARRVGKAPERVITVFNGWTHEAMVLPATGAVRIEPDDVNYFLRCRFTNKEADMAHELLPTAVAAARHFGSDRIVVVSAFRSPKYNLMLRKKGRQVSRKSQHTHGKALDFRLDGVSAARLRDWAKGLRLGGVGYYASSGFVHVDTAAVRYWTGD